MCPHKCLCECLCLWVGVRVCAHVCALRVCLLDCVLVCLAGWLSVCWSAPALCTAVEECIQLNIRFTIRAACDILELSVNEICVHGCCAQAHCMAACYMLDTAAAYAEVLLALCTG